MQQANIISFANITHPSYKGFRVRFSFTAACGRQHTVTADQVWGGDHYFSEVRDIDCSEAEDGCPDSNFTEVELIHPDRKSSDNRPGKRQRFIAVPAFGQGLGN